MAKAKLFRAGKRRVELGKLLARARRQAGLGQEEVSSILGYRSRWKVGYMETGKCGVEAIELEGFAALYGKPIEAFTTWNAGDTKAMRLMQNPGKVMQNV